MRKSLAKDTVRARDAPFADGRTIDTCEVTGEMSLSAPMLYGNDAFKRCAPPAETLQFVLTASRGRFGSIEFQDGGPRD